MKVIVSVRDGDQEIEVEDVIIGETGQWKKHVAVKVDDGDPIYLKIQEARILARALDIASDLGRRNP